MGYRPTITTKIDGEKVEVELGKFYGYIHDIDKMLSIQYLLCNGILDTEGYRVETIFWNVGPELHFTSEQFKEWIKLYEQDINNYDFSHYESIYYKKPFVIEKYPFVKEIIESDGDKEVFWG